MHRAFVSRCFPNRIDVPASLKDQPLAACQLSPRLAGVFRRACVKVLGDLDGRRVGDFAWLRNCGFVTLHELDAFVRWAESQKENAPLNRNGFLYQSRSSAFANRRSSRGATMAIRKATAERTPFTIPESLCQLRLDELPITPRLANVARSTGMQTLGDLSGRTPSELLEYKNCGWRTVIEIQHLIERATAGGFDMAGLDESRPAAQLLVLLEEGMAKLAPRDRHFLLARIEGLTFAEIGRRHGLTRARAHQVVGKALDTLSKTYGLRIPRLLAMVNGDSSSNGGLRFPQARRLCPHDHECFARQATQD